ncbi:hypothetical protein BOX15_Mlig011306g2 [Macrostomum lignano]|uniref:Uncharacterized protein n=1 Tax=Macrostomum lignano TaxID=282301 RepID=A0A267H4L8_9PLAT|nr:hypothetical protein BOX15_Mlig011306g2 [Macrostomum lignano]
MPKPEIWSVRMYGPHKYNFKHGLKRSEYLNDPEYQVDPVLLDSPWPARNAPCFALFNAFMERCTDCLELVQTTQHFRLLADAAEIGGAGSQSLDAIVREIHEKYSSAMSDFFEQVTNVLDLNRPKEFERAFFDFRTVVRELERCLAKILSQSLQQCPTVLAQLRLLEVFEGISGREIVQEVLKDKDELIVKSFIDDLMVVQEIFRSQRANPPPIRHMPRFVSTLYWLRGLRQRLEQPWLKIHKVSPHMLTGELGYQLKTLYAEVFEQVTSEEAALVSEWQNGVTDSLFDYMKNSLLVCKETGDLDQYEVNLDPRLVRLLREMRHVTGEPFNLGLTAAGRRLARLTDLDKLRTLAARLDTIVATYNGIMQSLTESEFFLLQSHVLDAQQLFRQGCSAYTWKLEESADFVERSHVLVLELLAKTLRTLKSNCDEIRSIADAWTSGVLDIFQGREPGVSYEPEQLKLMHRQLTDSLEARMQPSNNRIHALVESSFQSLSISKASPVWLAYVRVINEDIVFAQLKESVMTSLDNMANCLALAGLTGPHNPTAPILTVRLDLVQCRISFRPPLDEFSYESSVTEMAQSWITDFLSRAGLLTNLLADLPENDDQLTKEERAPFLDKILADVEVTDARAKILEAVVNNSANCIEYVEYLNDYRYLWVPDIAETFQQFLQGRASPNPARTPSRSMQNASSTVFQTSRSRPSSVRSRLTAQQEENMDAEAGGGELSLGERAFLTPKSSGQAGTCVPSLAEFQDEIELYLEARQEIQEMPDSSNQGWLLINMRPLKQVLITLANKWVYQFTSYLTEQVLVTLRELDEFLQKIEPQIERISGQEKDTYSFMRLMRLFNEISSKQVEMDARFDVMRRTIRLLDTYECELPEEIRDPDGLVSVHRWQQLKNKVISAKQKLGPRIHNERKTIETDLVNFQSNVQSLSDDLFESNVFNYSCLLSKVQELLADFSRTLRDVEEEAQDLREVQTLLGSDVIEFEMITECRETLDNLKMTWETVRLLLSEQADWKKLRWKRLSPSQLIEACCTQLARLERLPNQCHDWDVFEGICGEIAAIKRVLELIDQLKDPAMKPRHWKQLVRLTGGVIQINSESLEVMTLGELLKLGLQNNADHVTSIVKRAKSDKEIEEAIKNFDNLWMSKVFDLKLHYMTPVGESSEDADGRGPNGSGAGSARRTSISRMSGRSAGMQSIASLPSSLIGVEMESDTQIYLLDNTDKVFAELAEHQASLAEMLASSTAGSYVDDIGKWQRTLQHIETVLILWLRVQDKWLQMQNIYESEKAFSALPEYAKFQIASADFKRLMQATKKNQNLLQCCNRKYIVPILDRMDSLLRKCREELVSYLDGQIRAKFPRFNFLSAEDLFLVYGSCHDAELLNRHIGKLFENVGELVFTRQEDNPAVCEVTGIRSRLGEELPLTSPVVCRGLDCSWLGDLLEAIRAALKTQLAATFGEAAKSPDADEYENFETKQQHNDEPTPEEEEEENEVVEGSKKEVNSRPQSQSQSAYQKQQQEKQQQLQSILKRRLPKNDREALAMMAGEPISSVFNDALERLEAPKGNKQQQQQQDEASEKLELSASQLLDSVAEVCHLRAQIDFSTQVDQAAYASDGWKEQLGKVRSGLRGSQDLCRRLLILFDRIIAEAESIKAKERAAAAEAAAISRAASKKAVRLRQPRDEGEEENDADSDDDEEYMDLEDEAAEDRSLADTIRERAASAATPAASGAAAHAEPDADEPTEEGNEAAKDDAEKPASGDDDETGEPIEGQGDEEKPEDNESAAQEPAAETIDEVNQFDFSDKPVEDPMVKIRANARLLLVPAQQAKLRQLILLFGYQIALIDAWTGQEKDGHENADEAPDTENSGSEADVRQRFLDQWAGELRYTRSSEDGSVQLHCCGQSLSYGWEYIGSAERCPQSTNVAGNLIYNTKHRFPTLCHSDNSDSGSSGGSMELFAALWNLAVAAGRPLYCVACSPELPDLSLEYAFEGLTTADGIWLCLRSVDSLCLESANKLARLLTQVNVAPAAASQAPKDSVDDGEDAPSKQQQQDDEQEAVMTENSACFCTLGGNTRSQKRHSDTVPFAVRPIEFEDFAAALPISLLTRLVPLRITEPSVFTQRAQAEAKLDLIGFKHPKLLADRLVDFLASYRSICDRLEDSFADRDREFRTLQFLSQVVDAAERHYPRQVELHLNKINVHMHNQFVTNQRMRTEMSSLMAQSEPRPEPLTKLPEDVLPEVQSHSLLLGLRDLLAPAFRRQSEGQLFEQLAVELFPGCPPSLDFREANSAEERFETPKSEDGADAKPPATAASTTAGAKRTPESAAVETTPLSLVAALDHVLNGDRFINSVPFECSLTKLYNMAEHSNAVAIVGPSGVGKTTVFRAYERLMQLMQVPMQVQCLYPGALSAEELVGAFEKGRWQPSVLGALLSQFTSCSTDETSSNDSTRRNLLRLDGTCSAAQWEVIQSLLDKPNFITLLSGQKLIFPEPIRVVWEMETLEDCSPGLASRVQLMFVGPDSSPVPPFLTRWLEDRPGDESLSLMTVFDKYLPKLHGFVTEAMKQPTLGRPMGGLPRLERLINQSYESSLRTTQRLLESLINSASLHQLRDEDYEQLVVFAAVWGFGANLTQDSQRKMSEWWRATFENERIPQQGSIFEYYLDVDRLEWQPWQELIPMYQGTINSGIPTHAFVQTPSSQAVSYCLSLLSDLGTPVLLVGPRGCGKSAIVGERIRTVCSSEVSEILNVSVYANRYTNARLITERLDEKLEWKDGKLYVPLGGKRLMCFVDDLNLAATDDAGRQTSSELLRQLIDEGGHHFAATQSWRTLKSLHFIAALNPGIAGGATVKQRFVNHFSVLAVNYPSQAEQCRLFSTMIMAHFFQHNETALSPEEIRVMHSYGPDRSVRSLLDQLVRVTVDLQENLRSMFLPTARRSHYVFSLRTLSTVFRNLCQSLNSDVQKKPLLQLWRNECDWVFAERMVDYVDKDRYRRAFANAVKKQFAEEYKLADELMEILLQPKPPLCSSIALQDSGLVSAISTKTQNDPDWTWGDGYAIVSSNDRLRELITDAIAEFNKNNPTIRLPLYNRTLAEVSRIARTLLSPHNFGHIAVVAEGNPGISALLARLAAHLAGFKVIQSTPASLTSEGNNKVEQFKRDLVAAYTNAGVKNEKLMFLPA